jgi:hypothetical protein
MMSPFVILAVRHREKRRNDKGELIYWTQSEQVDLVKFEVRRTRVTLCGEGLLDFCVNFVLDGLSIRSEQPGSTQIDEDDEDDGGGDDNEWINADFESAREWFEGRVVVVNAKAGAGAGAEAEAEERVW